MVLKVCKHGNEECQALPSSPGIATVQHVRWAAAGAGVREMKLWESAMASEPARGSVNARREVTNTAAPLPIGKAIRLHGAPCRAASNGRLR
jgi:hypothetical protein